MPDHAVDPFSALEHRMWEAGAGAYRDSFAKVTAQTTNALLDAAGVETTKAMSVAMAARESIADLGSRRAAATMEVSREVRRAAASSSRHAPRPASCSRLAPRPASPPNLSITCPVTPQGGMRILDVATGTGVVADGAAARGASEVVAVDFSAAMLEQARAVAEAHPSGVVTLLEGDAAALPLPDESFDAVVIGFGLLHLPDPASALAEAHRVLKPGGRLAFSVWEEPSRGNDAFAALLDALAEHGDKEAALPDTSAGAPLPFFHFASLEASTTACAAAGFDKASVGLQRIPSSVSLRDEHELVEMFATSTARSRALLELQSADQLEAIRAAVAARVRKGFGGAWVQGEARSTAGAWRTGLPGAEEASSDDAKGPGRRPRPSRRDAHRRPAPPLASSGRARAAGVCGDDWRRCKGDSLAGWPPLPPGSDAVSGRVGSEAGAHQEGQVRARGEGAASKGWRKRLPFLAHAVRCREDYLCHACAVE